MDFTPYIDRQAMIESLQKLIRIKSVSQPGGDGLPFGKGCADCLDAALETGRSLGFEAHSFDGHMGWCEYGEGDEMVAVLAHLDVVPEGGGWHYEPYGGTIDGDRIYGRGAIDNKGPAVAALYALKAVKESGVKLSRRVRVMFGLNEEQGSACIKYYVDNGGEIPVAGFTPDGAYPIINGEKGIIAATYSKKLPSGNGCLVSYTGGAASNIVPNLARAEISWQGDLPELHCEGVTLEAVPGGFAVTASGVAAHGSTPELGLNANGRLMAALAQLPLEEETRAAAAFIAEKIGLQTRGENLGIAISDEVSGDLTVCLSPIRLTDGVLYVSLGIRYPVTKTLADFEPQLDSAMASAGFKKESLGGAKPLYVPPETPFIQKLARVYEEQTGDKAELISIGGGTYAKAIPNVVAFGPVFPGEEVVEHGPDEFANLDNLYRNAQIMASAICTLATD